MIEALYIQVKGIVQGVGFRPFVYRLARKYLVTGWVLNATDGVFIHAEAETKHLDEFVLEISENPPVASRVEEIDLKEVPLEGFDSFEIRFSDDTEVETTTLISPDLATCEDCERELFNSADRRYRYPFINCTNCGPRFTIINELPYDRKHTSMQHFPMCSSCKSEYEDPLDRRFHAQPDACFDCGPYLSWRLARSDKESVQWGNSREASDAILRQAVSMLRVGKIVAVKGLGGFHLACDAQNEQALATLRERKRRKGQAFAVMMRDLDQVSEVCEVNEAEKSLLTETQRPIVLLKKAQSAKFAKGLADNLSELGVMLPCTPLQHLLVHDFGSPLVMTSANLHDEPIVTDDEEAYRVLGEVADAFLGHNRAIVARYDDSVLRVLNVGSTTDAAIESPKYFVQFIRRARGYAPLPLLLPEFPSAIESLGKDESETVSAVAGTSEYAALAKTPKESSTPTPTPTPTIKELPAKQNSSKPHSVFATGPEQKNTFCLTRGRETFVSQHIGDMENAETFDAWLESKKRYERLFEINPKLIACDLHPEYLSGKWAREQKLALVEVQHHHAHIVSVMAENKLEVPVAGIAFDGTGYGIDGRIWGGEVLLCNYESFERFANFAYVPMPGGAAAIKYPLRMAYGALWTFDLLEHPAAQSVIEGLGNTAVVCGQMIEKGLNTPLTSSVGRLFDAASAILGLCTEARYEGEGAILLEAAIVGGDAKGATTSASADTKAERATANISAEVDAELATADIDIEAAKQSYLIDIIKNTATENSTAQDTSVLLLDAAPAFRALLDDLQQGIPTALIAQKFHNAFVQAVVEICRLVEMTYGITTIALSGGVFMNRYLTERLFAVLPEEGFVVAVNQELPPNDACISYGQAVVALATNKGTD